MAANNTLAAKHFSVNYSSLITVLVGKTATKFQLHEDIIIHSSDFFRRACSGDFKEAAEKVVRLPEMDIDSFTSYVHWIYTGTIKIKADEPDEEKRDGVTIQLALIRLYIAADILSDMALRNATIDRIVATGKNVTPGPTWVNLVYDNTPDGSKLRQLMIDYYLNYTNIEKFKEKGEKFPKAFLFDVICNNMSHPNMALNSVSSPIAIARSQKSCRYHEHGDQLPECSKG